MTGEPIKPRDLSELASLHWDAVIPPLVESGVAKSIDTHALAALCEWWSEYKTLQMSKPDDEPRRRVLAMNVAFKAWRELAKSFGLTPVDRARLTVGDGEVDDPAAAFIA